MTEKDKIIEIIGKSLSFDYSVIRSEELADALIKAGYGDVKEWKRRAEVAERNDKIKERALDKACYDKARTYCPNDRWDCTSKHFKNVYIRKAEREIAEEERR